MVVFIFWGFFLNRGAEKGVNCANAHSYNSVVAAWECSWTRHVLAGDSGDGKIISVVEEKFPLSEISDKQAEPQPQNNVDQSA